MAVKKQCNHAGCKTLIDYRQKYCGKHKAKQTAIKREESKAKVNIFNSIKVEHGERLHTCIG